MQGANNKLNGRDTNTRNLLRWYLSFCPTITLTDMVHDIVKTTRL